MEEETLLVLDPATGVYKRTLAIREDETSPPPPLPPPPSSSSSSSRALGQLAEALSDGDAALLSAAMGGNVVDRALATLPQWMLAPSYRGKGAVGHLGTGPDCLTVVPVNAANHPNGAALKNCPSRAFLALAASSASVVHTKQ